MIAPRWVRVVCHYCDEEIGATTRPEDGAQELLIPHGKQCAEAQLFLALRALDPSRPIFP